MANSKLYFIRNYLVTKYWIKRNTILKTWYFQVQFKFICIFHKFPPFEIINHFDFVHIKFLLKYTKKIDFGFQSKEIKEKKAKYLLLSLKKYSMITLTSFKFVNIISKWTVIINALLTTKNAISDDSDNITEDIHKVSTNEVLEYLFRLNLYKE